jgi:hypothetical protein
VRLRQRHARDPLLHQHPVHAPPGALDVSVGITHALRERPRPAPRRTVHGLLFGSLRRFGTLVLGLKESLVGTVYERDYDAIDPRLKLYRRRA